MPSARSPGPKAVLAYLVAICLHPPGRHQQQPRSLPVMSAASPSSGRPDYRAKAPDRHKTMTLATPEFIRLAFASCPAAACPWMVPVGWPVRLAFSYPCGCSRGCSGGCCWNSSAPPTTPIFCSSSASTRHSPMLALLALSSIAPHRVGLAKRPFAGPEAVLA